MPSKKSEVSEWVGQTHTASYWAFWFFQQQGIPNVLAAHIKALSAGHFTAGDVWTGASVLECMRGFVFRGAGEDNYRLERRPPGRLPPCAEAARVARK